jgi:hypothetical protein
MTGAEILANAGPTVSIPEAAKVLGISRGLGYALAGRGDLAAAGVRVLRLGARWRVPTADLRRAVGVEQAASPAA